MQYAKVKLRIEPFEPLEGEDSIVLENRMKPGTLTKEFAQILEDSIQDEARGGGIVGYPLMKVKLTILDAGFRAGETTEFALRAAATRAVRHALTEAGVVLLEPIMNLEVVTPDEFVGNIQADLQARRAIIMSSERRGDLCVLQAHVALSQMFGYSTQVRSLSQGRASYSMQPLKYDEAPPKVLEEMMG